MVEHVVVDLVLGLIAQRAPLLPGLVAERFQVALEGSRGRVVLRLAVVRPMLLERVLWNRRAFDLPDRSLARGNAGTLR